MTDGQDSGVRAADTATAVAVAIVSSMPHVEARENGKVKSVEIPCALCDSVEVIEVDTCLVCHGNHSVRSELQRSGVCLISQVPVQLCLRCRGSGKGPRRTLCAKCKHRR